LPEALLQSTDAALKDGYKQAQVLSEKYPDGIGYSLLLNNISWPDSDTNRAFRVIQRLISLGYLTYKDAFTLQINDK
jgi:hypothetical protein